MPDVLKGVLITRENAAEYGARGRAAQLRERIEAKEQADLLKQALAAIRSTVAAKPEQLDYRQLRLVRVREHLDRLDDMFILEKDPQRLSQLAQAMDKLSEQERLLAGRPAPKAEESRRSTIRQGRANSDVAAQERQAEPLP